MSKRIVPTAPSVNPESRLFMIGSSVQVTARAPDASYHAKLHTGRVGVVVHAERCDRSGTARTLYSVVLGGQIQVRLYASELCEVASW